MKFWPSYKRYSHKNGLKTSWVLNKRLIYLFPALAVALSLNMASRTLVVSAGENFSYIAPYIKKNPSFKPLKKSALDKSKEETLKSVTTTVFWVGESADSDNGFISNAASAWDGNWQKSYGGIDSPKVRKSYFPKNFTPKENSFYFALPYSDLTETGKRKKTANACPGQHIKNHYSWCKNSWIMIKAHGKTAYAQWEDVGPFESDDYNYVFGRSDPKNRFGSKAGLDVSPAIQTYLGLSDVDKTAWQFVSDREIPNGPWKKTITTSKGYKVN